MRRREVLGRLGTAAVLGGMTGCAGWGVWNETPDHALLAPPQPGPPGSRIEVIEFFWYGCPHCADLHPHLHAWSRTLAPDVVLRLQPAVFTKPDWEFGARLHHALQALGAADRMAAAVFDAVQLDGIDPRTPAGWSDWARSQGLDPLRLEAAWASPQALKQVDQARRLTQTMQIRGVPSLVVDGRFMTSPALAGSAQETLQVVDRLLRRARAERSAGA